MSIAASVTDANPIRKGETSERVRALQVALQAVGYRINPDGVFGDGTDNAVRRFQSQHGLTADGAVGPTTAKMLDGPHDAVMNVATTAFHPSGWPHDDTASMISFYGKPWENSALLGRVTPPWRMIYTDDDGKVTNISTFAFHVKCIAAMNKALAAIWDGFNHDQKQIEINGVHHFGGSYNYRAIRGSSRLSTHAFGCSIDLNPSNWTMGRRMAPGEVSQVIVDAFDAVGFFWGNRYKGRPDAMHWQAAHE